MRPIRRNVSDVNYKNYQDAKADLVSRLGSYCSYCERYISSVLAVEHIQPKGLAKYSHLENTWSNFLLSCVNCNSTKKDKDFLLGDVLLPDRDNTSAVFCYHEDGTIGIHNSFLGTQVEDQGKNTLSLTGLDKPLNRILDSNGLEVALDRVAQRVEVYGKANLALRLYEKEKTKEMIDAVAMIAQSSGYFSIWYRVFLDHPDVLSVIIKSYPGTFESGCFSNVDGSLISPCPNQDQLEFGGRA